MPSTPSSSLSCNMDIIALQVRSDGWLSDSRTVHGENFNYELIRFIMSVLICLYSIVLPVTSRAGSSARGAFASAAFA